MPFKQGKSGNPDTQFPPGQSGNPAGKPKGTRHISYYIRKMMEDDDFVQKLRDGTELKGAPITAIIKAAIAKSISGDKDAREWLAKYGYAQKFEHVHKGNVAVNMIDYGRYREPDDNTTPPVQA